MFAQLIFDLGRVSDEIEFVDLAIIAQRHNGAGNEVRRTKVTAHRIEGDLHRCKTLRTLVAKCKVKILASSLREARRGECPTFGVVQRATAPAICFLASKLVARGS